MGRGGQRRSPCPGRIFEDLGTGFMIGAFGGSIFYFFGGIWNSPKGQKIRGGIGNIRNRSTILGGSFALWGGCFSAVDCALIYVNGGEQFMNPIIAGAVTGFVLAIRSGMTNAIKNGVIGGAILALIEGASFLL